MLKNDTEHSKIEELLPAYALRALEPGEVEAVENHLIDCRACQQRLAGFERVTEALPLAVGLKSPPRELRERVLRMTRRERIATESRVGWWTSLFRPQAAMGAVLASVLLAIVAFGWALSVQGRLSQQELTAGQLAARVAEQDEVLGWLSSSEAVMKGLQGTEEAPRARGMFVGYPEGNSSLLVAYGLPPLPEGKTYQLWLIRDSKRTSGGTFAVDSNGNGLLLVKAPDKITSYQAVGITTEPLGGSPGPTGNRVMGGNL